MFALLGLVFGVIGAVGLTDEAARDEVHSLPGFEGPLPSQLFSGYVPIQKTKRMHYWFVASEGDPRIDPVILWMQGGPGFSSALGLLGEMGPYRPSGVVSSSDSNVPPGLYHNPYSWTKLGSMIFIESPCGVGFSDCDSEECPPYTDTLTADENLEFLTRFFERFEQFRQNDFYIAGESYAGVYVPMLAERVAERADLFNLKGVAVGNGCIGFRSEGGCGVDKMFWHLKTLYALNQYSTDTFETLMQNCEAALRSDTWLETETCRSLVNRALKESGSYNKYNVYDECQGAGLEGPLRSDRQVPSYDYPCGVQRAISAWLNHPKVKEALHVDTSIFWKQNHDWTETGRYIHTERNVLQIYRELIQGHYKLLYGSNMVRVLIYFGDTDTTVPYNGGEQWVKSLGLRVLEAWRPWTIDGKHTVAGHIVRYEKDFDFVTILGAGHMVPQYKPRAAFSMFEHWLRNESFPVNDPQRRQSQTEEEFVEVVA